jgi:hypothetical protein
MRGASYKKTLIGLAVTLVGMGMSLPAQAAVKAVATPAKVTAKKTQALAPAKKADTPKQYDSISDAIMNGHAWLSFRLRNESVDTDSTKKDAMGTTLRSRIGFQTGEYHHLSALVEANNASILGAQTFYTGDGSHPRKSRYSTIADPNATIIDQAYLNYTGIQHVSLRAGRQFINLDDQRFVGTVGFRQTEQSYDAVSTHLTFLPHTDIYYAYVWRVNRIWGPQAPSPFDHFTTHSNFINIDYSGLDNVHIVPFAYLIDNSNASTTSSNTYGLRVFGAYPLDQDTKALYQFAYARQKDGYDNPNHYAANYYNLSGGLTYKTITGKLGYEVMGGNGRYAFQTPYATLHKFDGWADMFLTTPVRGLTDLSLGVNATIKPLANIVTAVTFHDFKSSKGSRRYGDEWDLSVGKTFFKQYLFSIEYANFDAKTAAYSNTQKLWLTVATKFSS